MINSLKIRKPQPNQKKILELTERILEIQQKQGILKKPKKRNEIEHNAVHLGFISEKLYRILKECTGDITVEEIGIKLGLKTKTVEKGIRELIKFDLIDY